MSIIAIIFGKGFETYTDQSVKKKPSYHVAVSFLTSFEPIRMHVGTVKDVSALGYRFKTVDANSYGIKSSGCAKYTFEVIGEQSTKMVFLDLFMVDSKWEVIGADLAQNDNKIVEIFNDGGDKIRMKPCNFAPG